MLEQNVKNRVKEQFTGNSAVRMMLISKFPAKVQNVLSTLILNHYDLIYMQQFDESVVSSLKPKLIIYYTEDDRPNISNEAFYAGLYEELHQLQKFQIPLLILMDDVSYLRRAPIEISNATVMIWPVSQELLLEEIERMQEAQARFIRFEDCIVFKDLEIDTRRMIVKKSNIRIDLTKTEYDLLIHFLNSDGSVQTREALLEVIWGLQFFEGSNIVDVHIKSLRKKLADSAVDPKYIVTVRGVGYRLADL